jgi:hypothetical protein
MPVTKPLPGDAPAGGLWQYHVTDDLQTGAAIELLRPDGEGRQLSSEWGRLLFNGPSVSNLQLGHQGRRGWRLECGV